MLEMESWLDIKGYEGLYQVSDMGRVRSLDRSMLVMQARYPGGRRVARKGKVLKAYYSGTDRQQVRLSNHGVARWFPAHRLVATHFIANPTNLPVVNHLNHNHRDNRAVNLEWCTQSHNIRHAIAAGRWSQGFKKGHK